MKRTKTGWLLAVLVLALWPGCQIIQEARWEKANAAGMEAYEEGRYGEAEERWLAALEEAEAFGPDDERLATSLNNLALLYQAQGKYAEAEPLYERSLVIYEKALGPEHPDVATSLNNLAELYRTQGKYAEAEPLYHRKRYATTAKALKKTHARVSVKLLQMENLLRSIDVDCKTPRHHRHGRAAGLEKKEDPRNERTS